MVIETSSGLMSRCRCISDAYYLVKKYEANPQLTIIWPLEKGVCNIPFWKVFSQTIFSDIKLRIVQIDYSCNIRELLKKGRLFSFIKQSVWRILGLYKIRECRKKCDGVVAYFPIDSSMGYEEWMLNCWNNLQNMLTDGKTMYVRHYQSLIYPRVKESLSVRAESIVFAEQYRRMASELLQNMDTDHLVGIHIRGTDHSVAKEKSPFYLFCDMMDEEIRRDDRVRFFLATDEPDIELSLKDKYGYRICTLDNKVWGRDNEGVENGIVECLCLAGCKKIIGSYSSQFSGFASELGKNELIICKR